jgi:hypothetical protein
MNSQRKKYGRRRTCLGAEIARSREVVDGNSFNHGAIALGVKR